MSEGPTHLALVAALAKYLLRIVAVDHAPILVDRPGLAQGSKPPLIDGFVPDLFFGPNSPVIGEAKTLRDLETQRSYDQIGAFMRYVATNRDARFFLAVPLVAKNYARSVVQWNIRDRGLTTGYFEIVCPCEGQHAFKVWTAGAPC